MQKKSRLLVYLVLLIISLPLLCLAIVYNSMPNTIPMHFNSKLEPDRMGDKSEILIPLLVMTGVALLVFFVLRNIRNIDPKRSDVAQSATFNKMGAGVAIFVTALNFLILRSAFIGAAAFNNFLFPVLGLLFAFLGNYMNNIKPNYFAGFRLPWTLSDNDNWRKTHHLAGKIWFWAGISLAVTGLFVPGKVLLPFLLVISVVMSIIPVIFSYRLFKSRQ